MATIKLIVEGVPVEVETVSDALELIRASAAPPQQQQLSKVNGSKYVPPADALDWTDSFLSAIRTSGSGGVETQTIVHALGVKHPKAVGGRMAVVNKILEQRSFEPRDVYSNDRNQDGVRMWRQRGKLDAALAAIRQEKAKQR
jgi:hypothetical protein